MKSTLKIYSNENLNNFLKTFLKEYELKLSHIFFYCLSFATLCYPLSGTPFAYIHAYIFSLIAIFNLLIAIKNNNKFIVVSSGNFSDYRDENHKKYLNECPK